VGIADNEEGWKEDEEFARQRIAGNNPILIKLLTVKSCSSPFVMTMMMISFILLLSHFRFNILLQRKIWNKKGLFGTSKLMKSQMQSWVVHAQLQILSCNLSIISFSSYPGQNSSSKFWILFQLVLRLSVDIMKLLGVFSGSSTTTVC